jgi:molybdenum cofactor guanylyltransferase
MFDKSQIETFVLAGGKSSRMGTEKGLIMFKGKRFVEHVIDAVKNETSRVSIVSNTEQYDYLGLKTYSDLVSDRGPLAGIYTGLTHATHPYALFVSCDLPLIDRQLIRFLRKNMGGDVLAPVHDSVAEPLCAIYSRRCVRIIGGLVKHNRLSITAALRLFDTRYIDVTAEDFYQPDMLTSINTPLQLEKLIQTHYVSES